MMLLFISARFYVRVNVPVGHSHLPAWSPEDLDVNIVYRKIRDINPYVVVHDGKIIAYADVQPDGLIDHFFCHREFQGMGIGRKLFARLEQAANANGLTSLYANVSITARPFFEAMGFSVAIEQTLKYQDQALINYKMVRNKCHK